LLDPDGVVYVVAPPRFRKRVLEIVRSSGLEIGPRFLHLGQTGSALRLVPLSGPALRYAAQAMVAKRSRARRLAAVALRRRGAAVLLGRFSRAGVVARRPGAQPLLAWLAIHDNVATARSVVVARSWRRDEPSFVLTIVDRDGEPRLVAKVGRPPFRASTGIGEAEALRELGPAATAAGASVPVVVWSGALHGIPALAETAVSGRRAALVVAERPEELGFVLQRLLAWLARWNAATAVQATLTDELFERDVLGPARSVAAGVDLGDAYADWLRTMCSALAGTTTALTAAHDDLTLANVLVEGHSLGIVDWDTARPRALPLVDFFYAVVDAHAATQTTGDRLDAFSACFSRSGARRATVEAWEDTLAAEVGASGAVLQAAFHSCWLHHAANELAAGERTGPFARIAARLATAPDEFGPRGLSTVSR
jgi:hypothetical protein